MLFLLSQFFSKLDEVIFQVIFDLWVFEGVVNRCFHKAKLIPNVVTSSCKFTGENTLCFIKCIDSVGKLDFISSTGSLIFEDFKNFWCEQIASDDCQITWSIFWSWQRKKNTAC